MLIIIGWVLTILMLLSYLKNEKYIYSITFAISFILGLYLSGYMWLFEHSIVQSLASLIGSLYSIYLIHLVVNKQLEPRNICKMIAISGLILLPLYSIQTVQHIMIEHVINETSSILNMIGYDTSVNLDNGAYYINFEDSKLRTEIVLACTGVGSIAIFVGLISAIGEISKTKKIASIMLITGVIYILNTVRNVFIAASYGGQHFHIFPTIIEQIFGRDDHWVSYYIADRIISQLLAAVVLIYLTIYIFNTIGKKSELEDELVFIIENTVKLFNKISRVFI